MKTSLIAVGVALALVAVAAPGVVPALEDVSFAGSAEAKIPKCVYGSDSDCIVQVVCVREPCEPDRIP